MSKLLELASSSCSFLSWTQVIVAYRVEDTSRICGIVSWFNPKTLIDNRKRIVPPTGFESENSMIARANGQHPRGVFFVPYLAIRIEFLNGTLAAELKNGCMR
jgi:hypothetical protein